MSIQILSITTAAPTRDSSLPGVVDSFNTIPTANDVYTLYQTENDTARKTAIIKGIRFVNTHTAAVKISVYFNRPNTSTGQNRRRLLAPPEISLPAGGAYIDDGEITLEPGDGIQAKADTANVIQFVISGIERDVV